MLLGFTIRALGFSFLGFGLFGLILCAISIATIHIAIPRIWRRDFERLRLQETAPGRLAAFGIAGFGSLAIIGAIGQLFSDLLARLIFTSVPAAIFALTVGPGIDYYRYRIRDRLAQHWEWLGQCGYRQWHALALTYMSYIISIAYYWLVMATATTWLIVTNLAVLLGRYEWVSGLDVFQIYCGVLIFLATGMIPFLLWRWANPHMRLVGMYLSVNRRTGGGDQDLVAKDWIVETNFRPARWRTRYHKIGFKAAKAVERCSTGMQRRLPATEMEAMARANHKLAIELRKTGLTMNHGESPEWLRDLLRAAVIVIAAENPVACAKRLDRLLSGTVEGPAAMHGRFRTVAERTSNLIQTHWPTVRILGLIMLVGILAGAGKIAQVVAALRR